MSRWFRAASIGLGILISISSVTPSLARSNNSLFDRMFNPPAGVTLTTGKPTNGLQLRTGQHSLHHFRVYGPIAHMPEYAKAFSCDPAKVLLSESERANIW